MAARANKKMRRKPAKKARSAAPPSAKATATPPEAGQALRALQAGVEAHQAGRLDEAAAQYWHVISSGLENPDAYHLLGVIHHQKGESDKAIELIRRAIAINPDHPHYHTNLGVALQVVGETDEAVKEYRSAVAIHGAAADAHGNLGHLLKDLGRHEEAVESYEAAIEHNPAVRSVHKQLATLYLHFKRHEEAAELFARYLETAPDDAEARNNYGCVLGALGRHEEAERQYRRAHELEPDSIEICRNLGNTLIQLGRKPEGEVFLAQGLSHAELAVDQLRRHAHELLQAENCAAAIPILLRLAELDPDDADLENDLGSCLGKQGKTLEAILHFRRATELDPQNSTYFANLGAAHSAINQFTAAVDALSKAVELDPQAAVAHANLCLALKNAGRVDEANLYSHMAALLPEWEPRMQPALLAPFRATCDFDGIAELGDIVGVCEEHVDPISLLGVFLNLLPMANDIRSDKRISDLHKKYGAAVMERVEHNPLPQRNTRPATGPIRIGFLSSDLRSHVVAKFIKPFFDNYDRERFEIHCYSLWDLPNDRVQTELRERSTSFNIVLQLSDREIAERIRQDGLDFLIDLNGATQNSHLEALAYQPAAVQMTWLGYPHTTGIPVIDYMLVDSLVKPTVEGHWAETPLVLPRSWVCFTDFPEVPICDEIPMARNGIVTFGQMNASYKLTPSVIEMWARVLGAVAGSRFLFVRPEMNSPVVQTNLAREFAKHGIGAERLFFIANEAGQSSHFEHYNEIDICLDTFPATGGTTTCDTLWMGVPLVSLVGDAMHQRLSHALLHHAGVGGLSVDSADAYFAKAVELAGDPARLAEYRRTLRDRVKASPLCDGPGFTADFQNALLALVEKHKLR